MSAVRLPTVGNWLQSLEDIPRRHYWKLVLGVLCVALSLRLLALLSLSGSIYFNHLLFDERVYHNWAVQIMNGTWRSNNVYEFAPLFAYFAALVYKLFHPDILLIRFTNILFGVLTCLFICLSGHEIGGRRIGFFSLIVATLCSPLIFYSIVPLKTAMSLVLFSLFIWLFFRLLNNRSHWYEYILTGIIAGMMVNVRPNYSVIIPPAVIFIIVYGYRDRVLLKKTVLNTVVLIIGFIIAVLPFMIRNYIVAGEASLTVSQSGFNLYVGNNPNSDIPYYRPVPFASSSPFKQGIHFNIEASRRAGEKLSTQQASSFWIGEVIHLAQEHPVVFLKKLFQKALTFINKFEAGDHYHIGFISEYVPFFKIPMLSYWMILPLGMTGMAAGLFNNRKIAAGAAFFTLYAITLIAFYSNTRYRIPMLVILIPLALYGCQSIYRSFKEKEFLKTAFLISGTFFFILVSFLPVTGTDDMTAYYNTHALILNAQGKKAEAVKFWKISSRMNRPYSAFANLSLASFYWRKRDLNNAIFYLDRIQENSFGASSKYELLGDIVLKKRQPDKAELYYRKALDINSGKTKVWKKLIRLVAKRDRETAAMELDRYKIISSYYE